MKRFASGSHRPSRRRARCGGISLVEVMFALGILLLMAMMFGAAIPAATRGTRFSGAFQQAISVAQHKIDQLRDADLARLTAANLDSRDIIDSEATCTTSGANTSCKFTTIDSLVSYFGAGAVGTIDIVPYVPSWVAATSQYMLSAVTVTVKWKDSANKEHSYSASAMISGA